MPVIKVLQLELLIGPAFLNSAFSHLDLSPLSWSLVLLDIITDSDLYTHTFTDSSVDFLCSYRCQWLKLRNRLPVWN